MLGDRLLPAGVDVDRLGVGPQSLGQVVAVLALLPDALFIFVPIPRRVWFRYDYGNL